MPQIAHDGGRRLVIERPNGVRAETGFESWEQLLEAAARLAPLIPADATWRCEDRR